MSYAGMIVVPTGAYLLARQTEFWRFRGSWVGLSVVLLGISGLCLIQLLSDGLVPFGVRGKVLDWYTGHNIPRGSFGNRNYASVFLSLALPLVFYALYSSRCRSERWLHGISLACTLLIVLFIRTRSAWLGLIVSAVCFLFATGGGRFAWKKIYGRIGIAFAVLVFAVWGLSFVSDDFGGNKSSVFSTALHLLDGRQRVGRWFDYASEIEPFFGAGYGNFSIRATGLRGSSRIFTLRSDIHNDYLQNLAESGFVGLGLFVVFWVFVLCKAWRGRSDPLVVAAGASLVVVLVVQGVTFMMEKVSSQILVASVVAIIIARGPRLKVFSVCRGRFFSSVWFIRFLTLLMFFIFLLAGANLLADRRLNAWPGERGSESQAYQRLRLLSLTSVPMLCYDANISHYLCHELQGRSLQMEMYEVAGRFARHALALHPNDHAAMGVMADVALHEGRRDDALRWLARAAHVADADYDAPYAQKLLALRLQGNPEGLSEITEDVEASLREKGWLDNPYSPMLRHLVGMYLHQGGEKANRANEIWEGACENLIKPLGSDAPLPCNVRRVSLPYPEAGSVIGASKLRFRWKGLDTVGSYDLYFWQEGELKPAEPLMKRLKSAEADRTLVLEPNTIYFWQLELHGKYVDAAGPLWYFRTGGLSGKE